MSRSIERKNLHRLLDWMEKRFDGDLDYITEKGFEKSKEWNLCSGPLWEEIGMETIRRQFRQLRIHTSRDINVKGRNINKEDNDEESNNITDENNNSNDNRKISIEEARREVEKKKKSHREKSRRKISRLPMGGRYKIGNEYRDIMTLTKEELMKVADDYQQRVDSNAKERDFLKTLASSISISNYTVVGDRFSRDDIIKIHKTVESNYENKGVINPQDIIDEALSDDKTEIVKV